MRQKSTCLSVPGVLALLFLCLHLVGLIVYAAKATNDINRVVPDNEYTKMWLNVVGFVLVCQSLFVISREFSTKRVLHAPLLWIAYGIFMLISTIMLFASYMALGERGTAVWFLTWFGGGLLVLIYSMKARRGYLVDSIMNIPHHRLVVEDSAANDAASAFLDTVFVTVTILFVFIWTFFLALQGVWFAADRGNFSAPGELVDVSVKASTYKLHVYCQGTYRDDSPTYVLSNEEGTPMTALIALQRSLVNRNRRVCLYDRPGYGWSEPGYRVQAPVQVVQSLKQALDKMGEKGPFIMAGYGAGGEYAQLYTHIFPTAVAGMVLIDSYPNREYLKAYALNQITTNEYNDHTESTSHYFQSMRVVSPMGWQRPRVTDFPGFEPTELLSAHISLYSTNSHWQARYFEYDGCGCRPYQALQGYRDQNTTSFLRDHNWPLTWPALPKPLAASSPDDPGLPLLVITANQSLHADCRSNDSDLDEQECNALMAEQSILQRQTDLYLSTLSNNHQHEVCPDRCDHNLVYTSADWVSLKMVDWYGE